MGCKKHSYFCIKTRSKFISLRKIIFMAHTDWQHKSREQAQQNKCLKKRVKELTKSREEWKEKSIRHKARADKLETDLKKIKNRLT